MTMQNADGKGNAGTADLAQLERDDRFVYYISNVAPEIIARVPWEKMTQRDRTTLKGEMKEIGFEQDYIAINGHAPAWPRPTKRAYSFNRVSEGLAQRLAELWVLKSSAVRELYKVDDSDLVKWADAYNTTARPLAEEYDHLLPKDPDGYLIGRPGEYQAGSVLNELPPSAEIVIPKRADAGAKQVPSRVFR